MDIFLFHYAGKLILVHCHTVFIGSITATYFLAITESSALKTPREKLTVV